MRNFIQITITKKGENRARMGHPWVFEGEVLKESEKPEMAVLSMLSVKRQIHRHRFLQ